MLTKTNTERFFSGILHKVFTYANALFDIWKNMKNY